MAGENRIPPTLPETPKPKPRLGRLEQIGRRLMSAMSPLDGFFGSPIATLEIKSDNKGTAIEKKIIASPDDLPLRDVAVMIASIEEPFTLDEITQRFEEGHQMTYEASQILRSRIYALGAMHVIHGETIRDTNGHVTSRWNRTDDGDKILRHIIRPPKEPNRDVIKPD